MRRPRFDELGLTPAYALVGIGIALIAAPRTVSWLLARADANRCAFAELTHMEGL